MRLLHPRERIPHELRPHAGVVGDHLQCLRDLGLAVELGHHPRVTGADLVEQCVRPVTVPGGVLKQRATVVLPGLLGREQGSYGAAAAAPDRALGPVR